MVIDEELMSKARAARTQLTEAEKQARQAQAEFHTIVRRAHLAGGSLREIAQALGLSHQRVQQIVQSTGGTWWGRVWKSRTARRDMICTFCGRPPSELKKLLAGPNVYICDGCLEGAERAAAGKARAGAFALAASGSRAACSFCGKRGGGDRRVVTGGEANMCTECVGISRKILEERGE